MRGGGVRLTAVTRPLCRSAMAAPCTSNGSAIQTPSAAG
ncbi:MAG: hypothetical protein QOI25_5139 [Mycobacterium sp.]|jgi:hypothetical protein|nr:hypothetical protein [Mycobacterium sp.]MDT5328681.1 hypothetical protein [Mycobacterium sp.]